MPVIEDLKKLEKNTRAEIEGCLKSIELFGLETNRVEFRQIEGKLWEIKIRTHASGYRIFYIMLSKDEIILLHLYKKETQKAPKSEINIALTRMNEILIKNKKAV
jgi:phage-related protein